MSRHAVEEFIAQLPRKRNENRVPDPEPLPRCPLCREVIHAVMLRDGPHWLCGCNKEDGHDV